MPYIKQKRRTELLTIDRPKTPGELNYVLTQAALDYLADKGECYLTINDILGAMEGAKMEFYRRVAAPYEDEKKEENGDVYNQ